MPKIEREVVIENELGLHARPAAQFVQMASKFSSNVYVIKDGERADGKSIMSILTLEVHHGSKVILEVDGEDAEEVVVALENILKGKEES